jgi:hypothetical protein
MARKRRDSREFITGPAPRARGSSFYREKLPEGIDPKILQRALLKVNPGQFYHVIRRDEDWQVKRRPVLGEGTGPEWFDESKLPIDYDHEWQARSHAEALNKQLEKYGKIVSWNPHYEME